MKTNISIFVLILHFAFAGSLFSQVVINDSLFYKQWYLNMSGDENARADIRVLDAWARTMGNSNQKIADVEVTGRFSRNPACLASFIEAGSFFAGLMIK